MRFVALFLSGSLVACDSPSPNMTGSERYALQIDGYDLTVWQKHTQVEVIRHGFARREDQSRLQELMARAARDATGCALRPDSITGDTGVLRATLDCD